MKSTGVRQLGAGVTDIQRWRAEDEVHLPGAPALRGTAFNPETQPLDAILRRRSLNERLALDIVPEKIDPVLLNPAVLAETRIGLARLVRAQQGGLPPHLARAAEAAADLLEAEIGMDEEVREALAALVRG